jgi:hypothetical protein
MNRALILFPIAGLLLLVGADAQESHVTLVPWKVAEPGAAIDSPLVLYWLPSTRDEFRRSDLLVSRELALFSSQCVAMRVVRADDTRLITALDPGTELPAVVLTTEGGRVVGKVGSQAGQLPLRAVEELVRDELERRAGEAESMLDRARSRVEAGDVAAGVAIYRAVRDQRCVAPRQGREADRALRKLRKR